MGRTALVSLLLTCGTLTLYLVTLCPGVYWGDSAELVGASAALGIPHPPGYPLYTLLGYVATRLPLDPALCINLMSALSASLSVGLCAVIARTLGASVWSSALGALLVGVGPCFWQQATVAEVYAPGALFLLTALWMALLAINRQRFGYTLLAALIAGLGLGVHLSIATTGMGFVVLAWQATHAGSPALTSERRTGSALIRSAQLVLAGFVAALGACIFLWLPYRARQNPALNFGNPSTWDTFLWVIRGGTYRNWFMLPQGVIARALRILNILGQQLTPVGVPLGLLGLHGIALRRGWLTATAWALAVLGNIYFFFDYNVFDLEVFFLPTVYLLAIAAAIALDEIIAILKRRWPGLRATELCALLLALELGWGVSHWRAMDRSEQVEANRWGSALVSNLPASAVLLHYTTPPEWKYDCVFEWYFQLLKGARPDVHVLVLPSEQTVRALVRTGVPVFTYAKLPHTDAMILEGADAVAPGLLQVVEVPDGPLPPPEPSAIP
jgi:hypothetical protein